MESICPKCGAPTTPGATKCEYCGAALQSAPAAPAAPAYTQQPAQPQVVFVNNNANQNSNLPVKSRIAAAILAILLGGFGVHEFYLGRGGKGLLMLIFCWTGIPAIIGLGEDFLSSVKSGDTVTINGYTGEVTVCPDENELDNFKMLIKKDEEKKSLLEALRGKESATIDGKAVKLYANIGGVNDLGAVLYNDADGIGLFRSEFIYLEKDTYPTEQEQFEIYKRVAESMGKRTVIIRTLDIGADKQVEYFGLEKEENPALGYRAIRICLDRPKLFKTQLRAIFRASVFGNLSIMFPMIASVWEAKTALSICDEVKAELQSEGIIYARDIEIGIMIETPAAAIISDELAPLVDFFSIGTNDLTQYTLACDRQNPLLEKYADPHHKSILRLIDYTVKSAHKHGKWVGICGELASDTTLTEEFLKMGVDELSVSPSYVLPVRKAIREIDLSI